MINSFVQRFRLSLSSIAASQGGSLLGSISSTTAPLALPGRRFNLGDCEELPSSLSSSLISGLSKGPKLGLFINLLVKPGLEGLGLELLPVVSLLVDTTRDSGAASKCLGTPIASATSAAS